MSLGAPYEVPDFRLDPPDDHECSDETNCEYCHENLHGEERGYYFHETYEYCVLCQDYLEWQIGIGRRCHHFEEIPRRGGSWCESCEEFYLQLNIMGATNGK